jgi:SsrA-binding protein
MPVTQGSKRGSVSGEPIKIVADNRKARHDYVIEEKFEAGMALRGTEVKSLRRGRCNLKDSYAKIKNGEVWVHNLHIGPYPFAYYDNHEPRRVRKLLLHAYEIRKLTGKVNEQGYSLIPLQIYFKGGKAKILLALAKGKKKHDKRETIKRRDQEREMERAVREYK